MALAPLLLPTLVMLSAIRLWTMSFPLRQMMLAPLDVVAELTRMVGCLTLLVLAIPSRLRPQVVDMSDATAGRTSCVRSAALVLSMPLD